MKRVFLLAMLALLLIPLAQAADLSLTNGATYTIGVNETYDTVNVTNGAILYFAYNTTHPVLTVTSWMYVKNATISAEQKGFGGGGAGGSCADGSGGSGTGAGGGGGHVCNPPPFEGSGGSGSTFGLNGTNKQVQYGGGGGGGGTGTYSSGSAGQSGGGIIHILGNIGSIITINGTIISSGGSGGSGGPKYAYGTCGCGAGGGGASGGTILIDSFGILNLSKSILSVSGGGGGGGGGGVDCPTTSCSAGGGGSSGQIKVFYWTLYNSTLSFLGDTSPYFLQQTPDWEIKLNSPSDALMSNNLSTIFNCRGNTFLGSNISNLTLLIDGIKNYTQSADNNYSAMQTMQNIPEGMHVWNCEMTDIDNERYVYPSNRIFTIDITTPSLNMTIAPSYVSRRSANLNNVSFNWTSNDTYLSSTWLSFSGVNYTGIGTMPNFGYNLSITTGGTNYITIRAIDQAGNINSSVITTYLNIYNYSIDYQDYIVQNKETTIYFYLSATDYTQYNATLFYNGTKHIMTETYNPLYKLFSYTFMTPSVNSTISLPFYINFSLDNEIIRTETLNQTIQVISELTIAQSCSTAFMRFALQDEGNLSNINGTFNYNFKHGLSDTDKKQTYGTITNVHQFEICTNFSLSEYWLIDYGEITYSAPGYVTRRYYIYNGTYVSATAQNITLYDLLTEDSTSFQLEVESSSLAPYNNVYASLIRWYPNLNAYKTVEMGHTDENGKTVFHVKTEDVDYIIGIYELNGSVIKLPTETVRMICLTSPCTYTMRIIPSDADYTSFLNIVYTFTFDEATNIWTFTFSDSSGKTSEMNMTIWKDTGTNTYPVCSNIVSGPAGILTCNTSEWTGLLRGEVYRTASPAVPLASLLNKVMSTPFKSPWALWLSFIVGLPIAVLLAWVSPFAGLIGGVLMLLPALYFGAIPPAVIGAVALMAALVAHFIKRVR